MSKKWPKLPNLPKVPKKCPIGTILQESKSGGYPSYAKVDMTFNNNYNIMFGEEWLLSLGGNGDSRISTGGS